MSENLAFVKKKEEKRSSKRNALICIIYAGSRSLFPLFFPVLLGSTNNLFPCSRQRAKVAQRKKTSKMGKGKKKKGELWIKKREEITSHTSMANGQRYLMPWLKTTLKLNNRLEFRLDRAN